MGTPGGGSATLTAAATAGDKFLVLGAAVLDRLSSTDREGRFNSKTIDDDFDRNRLIQQEHRRDIDRSFKVDFGQRPPLVTRPTTMYMTGWNEAGQLANFDPPQFVNAAGLATAAQGTKADRTLQPGDNVVELLYATTVPSLPDVVRTTAAKLSHSISLLDFGGGGRGVADNSPAWAKAVAKLTPMPSDASGRFLQLDVARRTTS